MIEEVAPAKINLYLHVGPRRADGLHALDSLLVFVDDGDLLAAAPADEISLEVAGPFASALAAFPAESNLVWRAAEKLKAAVGVKSGAALTLVKNLPVASGVGGGSADAAAALRALVRLWRIEIDAAALQDIGFQLGADVPACLKREPVFVSGAGEIIRPGPRLPPLWACLVNPGVAMPTGPVFRAFDQANPAPPAPRAADWRPRATYEALKASLDATRNDLEVFAKKSEPSIAAVVDFLAVCPGCLLARMSGSGATVVGLFSSPAAAERAARLSSAEGWWSMATKLAGGGRSRRQRGELSSDD